MEVLILNTEAGVSRNKNFLWPTCQALSSYHSVVPRRLHHHHQPRGPPFHISFDAETSLTTHCCESVSFAIDQSGDLKIVFSKHDLAGSAGQAVRMEFLALLCLQVLSFDAFAAARAERVVELMVVVFAVGIVLVDVEVSCCESALAGLANEAVFMVATSQTAICGFYRFAYNRLVAASTNMLGRFSA